MKANIIFKTCLLLSVFVHLAVLYPWSFIQSMAKPRPTVPRIELTYFREGPVEEATAKDSAPSQKHDAYPAVEKKTQPHVPLTAEAYTEAEIDILPDVKAEDMKSPADTEEAVLMGEYHLKVREKIKTALERNGTRFSQEGEVYVKFIIDKEGILKDLLLYKASGKDIGSLETIAISSIREASPFPPFDKDIKKAELSFQIPIRFTLKP